MSWWLWAVAGFGWLIVLILVVSMAWEVATSRAPLDDITRAIDGTDLIKRTQIELWSACEDIPVATEGWCGKCRPCLLANELEHFDW